MSLLTQKSHHQLNKKFQMFCKNFQVGPESSSILVEKIKILNLIKLIKAFFYLIIAAEASRGFSPVIRRHFS